MRCKFAVAVVALSSFATVSRVDGQAAVGRLLASLHPGSEGDGSDEEIANVARPGPSCDFDNECDNADVCDGSETCVNNVCEPGTPLVCGDGAFCNGVESCNPGIGCQAGADPCDDGVACTVDVCNESLGLCVHTPDHSICSDGLFCTGAEACDPILNCISGGNPCPQGQPCDENEDRCGECVIDGECNDGIPCTTDTCNSATSTCTHAPNNAVCDDNLFCNGVETCSAILSCQPGTPPNCNDNVACTTDTCSESNDTCTHTTNNPSCQDGQFCNGQEVCNLTLGCQPGTPVDCGDNVSCTFDSCNESLDLCVHTPDNGACGDGQFCNGTETCHPTQGCQAGTAPNCNDNVACTQDSCDEAGDTCNHVPNNAACDDDTFCNGAEVCHPTQGCKNGAPPVCNDSLDCTTDSCSAVTDQCQFTGVNARCNDFNPCTDNICVFGVGCTFPNDNTNSCLDSTLCNGQESCQNGTCVPGAPLNCDDQNPCTDDTCTPSQGCAHQNDDTNACGDETGCYACAAGECIVLGPEECDDENPCTDDFCQPFAGCMSTADPSNQCDDGNLCNGVEACGGSGACNRILTADCNSNLIEDTCDVLAGSPDANDNEIPDECELGACCGFDGGCSTALQDGCASGTWHLDRSCDPNQCVFTIGVASAGCRYFGVTPNPSGDPSTSIAIRVTSSALPCMTKYVALDSGVGRLTDFASYAPPAAWGAVQVADSELLPGMTYQVRVQTTTAMSDPVSVTLRQWGDVVAPFGTINFLDISADVDCFKHAAGAPPVSACDVYPAVPDQDVSFLDISSIVDAFRGMPYPFLGPCP